MFHIIHIRTEQLTLQSAFPEVHFRPVRQRN